MELSTSNAFLEAFLVIVKSPFLSTVGLLFLLNILTRGIDRKRKRNKRRRKSTLSSVVSQAGISFSLLWFIMVLPEFMGWGDTIKGTIEVGFWEFLWTFLLVAFWGLTAMLWFRERRNPKAMLAIAGRRATEQPKPSVVTSMQTRRRRSKILGGTLGHLNSLSPDQFERYIAQLFRLQGYRANVIGAIGDHGVDIEVFNPAGEKELVQCKRWKKRWLGEGVVRDFYGALMHDEAAVRGYIVTTNFFSKAARQWAAGKPIDLVDGKKLVHSIQLIKEQRNP